MKKMIAMTAAAMILLASGCGSIEEKGKAAAVNTAGDVSSVSESSVSESESDTDESSSTETLTSGEENPAFERSENYYDEERPIYEVGANIEGYKGEYINDGNCVILNPHDYREIDKEMLYYSAELAIKQYNSIAKRDKQDFFDTLDLKRLLQSKYAVENVIRRIPFGYRDHPTDLIYNGSIFSYFVSLYENESDDIIGKYESGQEGWEDDAAAVLSSIMNKAAENVSVDNIDLILDGEEGSDVKCFNIKKLCHKYKSIDESEFFSQPEKFVLTPSEDTKYIINYSDGLSARFDEGVIFTIDMIVIDGDHAYHFDDCVLWLEGDKSSVMPFYVSISENRWEGLSAKEAGEKIYDEYYSHEALTAADLYVEAWDVLCPEGWDDCPDEEPPKPPTWDEITAGGDFALAASENGLDISAESSEARGDDLLCELYLDDEGTAYMIHDPDDESPFFIRYVTPDGKIAEYHNEDRHWW